MLGFDGGVVVVVDLARCREEDVDAMVVVVPAGVVEDTDMFAAAVSIAVDTILLPVLAG